MSAFFMAVGIVAILAFVAAAFGPLLRRRVDKAMFDMKVERLRQELLARHAAREKEYRAARAASEAAAKAEREKASHDSVAYANDVLKENE